MRDDRHDQRHRGEGYDEGAAGCRGILLGLALVALFLLIALGGVLLRELLR